MKSNFTPDLIGIKFNSPVALSQLEMENVNIGSSNTINGFATGINIGSQNSLISYTSGDVYATIQLTGITGKGAGQTPFTGVTGTYLAFVKESTADRHINIGYSNKVDGGTEGYNFGSNNRATYIEDTVHKQLFGI